MSVMQKPVIADNITQLIGKTPILKLSPKLNTTEANILLKLESENPMASVKDRLAYSIIKNAQDNGEITPGKSTLVEATSGNTGVALAQLGAALGYKVILCMPDSMSLERRVLIRLFGAELILTPAKFGMKGANKAARDVVAKTEGAYLTNQFGSEYNAKIHKETTGPEIFEQLDGKVDAFVAGAGTGGTITGVAQFAKEKKFDTKFYVVEPKESTVLAGGAHSPHKIQGIGAGFVPDVMDKSLLDGFLNVSSEDAIAVSKALALKEGLFAGISAGAAVDAAIQLGAKPEFKGKNIVVIIPSFGERYLSTALYATVQEEVKAQKTIDLEL